jgi:hypothetical protein
VLLQRVERSWVLDKLRAAATHSRGKFFGQDVATVANHLRVRLGDLLFSALQGMPPEALLARHRETVESFELLREVCEHVVVLAAWGYSVGQQSLVRERLGPVVGWRRTTVPELVGALPAVRVEGEIELAPFFLPVFMILVSQQLQPIPLAQMLAGAERGAWDSERRSFVPGRAKRGAIGGVESSSVGFEPVVRVCSAEAVDLGQVEVFLQGGRIRLIRLSISWPETSRRTGSNWLPEKWQIPLAEPEKPFSTILDIPYTDAAYVTLALSAWERRLGSLSTELRAILSGNYCISKSWTPLVPMVAPNHSSWDQEAEDKLWPTILKYLWKGVLEYVARHCRLPLCIMAVGAVPKASPPGLRLITDYRPINPYADPWKVRYVSLKELALILSPKSIFG